MTCHHALSLLDDLIDDELNPQDSADLKAHLDVCGACRSEYERCRSLNALLREHKAPEPDPEYWSEVASIIRARTVDSVPLIREESAAAERSGAGRRQLVRSLAVFAASLTLLVGTLLISNRHSQQSLASRQPSRVFISSGLNGKFDRGANDILTKQDQLRLVGGSLVVGAPSMVGRYSGLAGFMTSY